MAIDILNSKKILNTVILNQQLLSEILTLLNKMEGTLMATEADLQAALDKLAADVTAETTAVNALIAQLQAGAPVTQAQLDALSASVGGIDAAVMAATASVTAATTTTTTTTTTGP